MTGDQIAVTNALKIQGLSFRHFRGESDYSPIAAVLTGSSAADRIDRNVSVEDISAVYGKHLTNCDPYADMIFAEVNGEVVGYARGWWTEEPPYMRLYKHNAFLLAPYRRKGIGLLLLHWMENRLKDITRTHPPELQKQLHVNISQFETGAAILLEQVGYQPIRYFYRMVRPNLDDIADYPLPDGLEIRPVIADHYPAIWDSMHESPDEEWGYTESTEEAYQEWLTHPHFQPHLWQIAWDKDADKVAGTVLTFISHDENKQFDRQRGYTEGVSVSLEWRRRGLAKALISRSLQVQIISGMSESALVVDSQSAFGVTCLYESCGFQIVDRDTIYRKQL